MIELTTIQGKLNAPKNQRNNFGGYNYRSCEDILMAVKPLLSETKTALTISDEVVLIGDFVFVKATATIKNAAGESESTIAYARHPEQKKGMDDSQITGATSSYARKYALNGLFCIDDNKDADATNTHDKEEPTQAPQNHGNRQNRGNARGGNQNAGAGASRQDNAAPPSPIEQRLQFLASMGISREQIEAAVGADFENFNADDNALVRQWVSIMREKNISLEDAIAEYPGVQG